MRTGIAMQELQSRHNKQYILEDRRQKHKQIRKMTSEVGCAMGRENNAKKRVLLVSMIRHFGNMHAKIQRELAGMQHQNSISGPYL